MMTIQSILNRGFDLVILVVTVLYVVIFTASDRRPSTLLHQRDVRCSYYLSHKLMASWSEFTACTCSLFLHFLVYGL